MKVKLLADSLVGDEMRHTGEIVDIADEGRANFMVKMGQATKDTKEVKENPVPPQPLGLGDLGPGPNPRFNDPPSKNEPSHPISKDDDKKKEDTTKSSFFPKAKS
jgi:hypothetical protein